MPSASQPMTSFVTPLKTPTPVQSTLLLIITALALRFVFAASLGLGVDETYSAATARAFQWSTFDHPPLAWWMAYVGERLLGASELAVRTPFILLFCLTTWLMYALTARLYGAWAGFWAAFTLNLSPILGVADASFVVPDAPLLAALLAGAYCLARVFFPRGEKANGLWLLAAGFCGGLAMLSKYHGVFLFFGAGLFMLTSPEHRRWLKTPWPFLGALVALAVFSPVIYWNAEHDWVSFLFQSSRTGKKMFRPLATLVLTGGYALWLAPWIFVPLVALLIQAFRRGAAAPKDWLLVLIGAPPIALFTLVSIWSTDRVFPHWAAPGFLMLFPMLGREIAARIGDWRVRWALGVAAGLIVALIFAVAALASFAPPSIAGPRSPLMEALSWRDLGRELEIRGLRDRPRLFIAAINWREAGKIDFALGGRPEVVCLSDEPHAYGILHPADAHRGEDALFVVDRLKPEEVVTWYRSFFDKIEPLEPATLSSAGKPALELKLYLGRNFHMPDGPFSLRH